MSVDKALAHLNEASDVGSRTMDKMQAQTAQLDKMNTDMEQVNRNLDTTEAIVGDMEKGYFQYLGESAMSACGFDMCSKVETTVDIDYSIPCVKEGWLQKRGPMYGYKWEARWCVLYETGMVWFDDEQKFEKKGDTDIKKVTKSFAFSKNKAPGDAIKHRGEKEFGFVVDITPNAGPGKERRLFYFDGENQVNQSSWMEAIDAMARKMKKKHGGDVDISGAQPIDQVNDVLDTLHGQALDLGMEARKQANLVNQVTGHVDHATSRLDAQTARLKEMEKAED